MPVLQVDQADAMRKEMAQYKSALQALSADAKALETEKSLLTQRVEEMADTLEEAVSARDAANAALRAALAQAEQQIQPQLHPDSPQQRDRQHELAEVQLQLHEAQQEVQQLRAENAAAHAAAQMSQSMSSQLSSAKAELQACKQELAACNEKTSEAEHAASAMQAELAEAQERVEQLLADQDDAAEAHSNALAAQGSSHAQALSALQNQLAQVHQRAHAVDIDAARDGDARVKQLTSELAASETAAELLQAQLTSMEAALANAHKQVASTSADDSESHAALAEALNRASELQAELQMLQASHNAADQTCSQHEVSLKEYREQIDALRAVVQGRDAELSSSKQAVQQLTEQHKADADAMQGLQSDLAAALSAAEQFERGLAEAEDARQAADAQVSEVQHQLEQLQEELSNVNRQAAEQATDLQKRIWDAQSGQDAAVGHVSVLQQQLATLQAQQQERTVAEYVSLHIAVSEQQPPVDQLAPPNTTQAKVQQLEAHLDDLQRHSSQQAAEVQQLRAVADAAQADAALVSAELAESKSAQSQLSEQLLEAQAELDASVKHTTIRSQAATEAAEAQQGLQEQLEGTQADLTAACQKLAECQQLLQSSEASQQDLQAQLEQAVQTSTALQAAKQDSAEALKASQADVAALQERCSSLRCACDVAHASTEAAKADAATAQQGLSDAHDKLASLATERDAADERAAALQSELVAVNARLADAASSGRIASSVEDVNRLKKEVNELDALADKRATRITEFEAQLQELSDARDEATSTVQRLQGELRGLEEDSAAALAVHKQQIVMLTEQLAANALNWSGASGESVSTAPPAEPPLAAEGGCDRPVGRASPALPARVSEAGSLVSIVPADDDSDSAAVAEVRRKLHAAVKKGKAMQAERDALQAELQAIAHSLADGQATSGAPAPNGAHTAIGHAGVALQERVATLASRLAAAESALQQTDADSKAHQAEPGDLQQKLQSAEQRTVTLQEQLADAETAFEQMQFQRDAAAANADAQFAACAGLQRQLGMAEAELLVAQDTDAAARNDALEERKALQAELASVQGQLNDVRAQFEAAQSAANAASEAAGQCIKLRNALEAAHKDAAALRAQCDAAEAATAAGCNAAEDCKALQERLTAAEEELLGVRESEAQLQAELHAVQQRGGAAKATLDALAGHVLAESGDAGVRSSWQHDTCRSLPDGVVIPDQDGADAHQQYCTSDEKVASVPRGSDAGEAANTTQVQSTTDLHEQVASLRKKLRAAVRKGKGLEGELALLRTQIANAPGSVVAHQESDCQAASSIGNGDVGDAQRIQELLQQRQAAVAERNKARCPHSCHLSQLLQSVSQYVSSRWLIGCMLSYCCVITGGLIVSLLLSKQGQCRHKRGAPCVNSGTLRHAGMR